MKLQLCKSVESRRFSKTTTRRFGWPDLLVIGHESGSGVASGLGTGVRPTRRGSGGYSSSLELIKRVARWRWVHGEDHALLTMPGLLAVDPDGVGGQDCEGHRGEVGGYSRADGLESGGEADMSGMVWCEEGRARAWEG